MNKLSQLREAAERAEARDWYEGEQLAALLDERDFSGTPDEDGAFIAAADPDTIIALIEALEAAEVELWKVEEWAQDVPDAEDVAHASLFAKFILEAAQLALAKIAALKGES